MKNYGIYYNYKKLGDILMISFNPNSYAKKILKNNEVLCLFNEKEELIGINILNFSNVVKIKSNGFIPLINTKLLNVINSILINANLEPLEEKKESGFKIGKIISMEEHPESEHLHICEVDIGEKENLQIVCGSFNAKVGIKVVCATPYTFMPNGQIILPGKVLGIESFGMLCSGRELNLGGYDNISGLYILDDSYKIGDDFFKVL